MYVSAKREETLSSVGKLAERRLRSNERVRSADLGQERAFSKTLKDKQGLKDRRDLQVSNIREGGENAEKPEHKKPDFNSEQSQSGRKKSLLKVRQNQCSEPERLKETEQLERAVQENDRELAKIGGDSKQDKLAVENETEKFEEESKRGEVSPELFAALLTLIPVSALEGADTETKTRSAELGIGVQKALEEALQGFLNGAFDVMQKDSETAEPLKELAAFLQKAGIEDGKLQDFLKGLDKVVKEVEAKAAKGEGLSKEFLLQDLMAKLNVSSAELKKSGEQAGSESLAVSEETEPEDLLHGVKAGEHSEEKQGGAEEKGAELAKGSQKPSEQLSDRQGAKAVEESFSARELRIDEPKAFEKTNAVLERELKSDMKTEVFEQIKNHIAKQSVKTGKSEMLIRLTPEELGKVELKIEVHKDQVIAKMNVASQMVKEAIEANLSDLKSSLKDKGYDVTSFDVNLSDHSQESDARQYRQGSKGAKTLRVEESLEVASKGYIKTLEGLERGSTFEELA